MAVNLIILYLAVVLIIASVMDVKFLEIPNWLTFSTLAIGISYFAVLNGLGGFLFSVSGAAAGFGLLIIPFMIGGTGAGDVKLLGAVGSILGPRGVFAVFIFSCLLGVIYGLVLLAEKRLLPGTFRRYGLILKGFFITQHFTYVRPSDEEKQIKIRFGLAIALGVALYQVFGF